MAKKRTSWTEKLHNSKDLPQIKEIDKKMSKRWGEGTFVIPAPLEVDEIMRSIPEGKIITVSAFLSKRRPRFTGR
jgi:hypothetical protein